MRSKYIEIIIINVMIKLIVFDLDGVLVDSRDLHYHALNAALEEIDPKYIIGQAEHLSTYDGLPTSKKLAMLTKDKGLDPALYNTIWRAKQDQTLRIIKRDFVPDFELQVLMQNLQDQGYLIYVASNSIYATVKLMLLKKGLMEYVDWFVSNEDVLLPKPHPEIYHRCLQRAKIFPSECVVIEDSHVGRKAARAAGCWVCPVENRSGVTENYILNFIRGIQNKMTVDIAPAWEGKLNIVIPMAGEGSRFAQAGFSFPKPLIDVFGKPMIQWVVENLNVNPERSRFIFIVRQEHLEKYNLRHLLNLLAPNCEIIVTDGCTQGAACSVLLAKEYINSDEPLVIANSDQYLEWDNNQFLYSMLSEGIDAGISTFSSTHPKWSFAALDETGFVREVAEKKPISNHATTGIYYWKRGSSFVKYAEQMIAKNVRVNGEFYVCPVFNEALADGFKIKIMDCERMWGLGTPEDLKYFLDHYKKI